MSQQKVGDRVDLRQERNRFVAFAFAAGDLLLELGDDGIIQFASGAGCGLTAGPAESLAGHRFLDLIAEDDRAFVTELLGSLRMVGRLGPTRLRLRTHGGAEVTALMGGCRLPSVADRCHLTLTIAARAGGLDDAATSRDHGLLDRGTFSRLAGDHQRAAQRLGMDQQMTMVLIDGLEALCADLDDAGTRHLLAAISAYLRAASAGGDAAARLDGDRLALIHDGQLSAEAIAERLRAIVAEAAGGPAPPVQTFSLPLDAGDLSEADATRSLVYAIRTFAEGGDLTLSSLREGAEALMDGTLARIAEVRTVIDRRAFDVVFQPIVTMDDREIHHFEALSRLVGVASPQEFITFTEEVGLIEDFDLAVCQKVLHDLSCQAAAGFLPVVAMNVSARSLASDLFVEALGEILHPFPKRRRQLMLELTETVTVRDFERVNGILQAFRRAGHQVCLDDVGSGGTSFQSLYRLPVDFAKIDGQFVRNALDNPRDRTLLQSMIATCHKLDMAVIAEQIEEETQAAFLGELGVRFGQGYLFGRPEADYRVRYGQARPASRRRARRQGELVEWR